MPDLVNRGEVIVEQGELRVSGAFDNTGIISLSDATIRIADPAAALTNPASRIAGTGSFLLTNSFAMLNAGTIAPGPAPTGLTIDVDFVENDPDTARLEVSVGDVADKLIVTGVYEAAGELVVSRAGDVEPEQTTIK